jgi:hypothetical protein
MQKSRSLLAAAAAILAVGLAACGGDDAASDAASSAASGTSVAATTGAAATGTAAAADAAKVSANTAGAEEIQQALEAAGVDNADRWTREVMEYRPYDDGDASLAKLRQNLAKYNPGDDTMNKILSALKP